jgi:hypothetical protein
MTSKDLNIGKLKNPSTLNSSMYINISSHNSSAQTIVDFGGPISKGLFETYGTFFFGFSPVRRRRSNIRRNTSVEAEEKIKNSSIGYFLIF